MLMRMMEPWAQLFRAFDIFGDPCLQQKIEVENEAEL